MDNRRVFKLYREKVRASSVPYAKKGLFSKMKQYFTPESIFSKEEAGEPEESEALKTPFKSSQKHPDDTPNQVLLSFFLEKGDRPLTDIEYEGVVLLLSKAKSQANTPNSSVVYRGEAINKPFDHDTTSISQNDNTFATPYSQRVLKSGNNTTSRENQSAVFSTPDYKPVYHSVNNSFLHNVPSVKRVYQFSGLPSPYRTRIKAPGTKPKRIKLPEHKVVEKPAAAPAKPLSLTANTLLSILDGNSAEVDNKRFFNPYSRPQLSKRGRADDSNVSSMSVGFTPTKKKVILADDISRTISFSTSEEMPKEKVAENALKGTDVAVVPEQVGVPVQSEKKTPFTFGASETQNGPEQVPVPASSAVPKKKVFAPVFAKNDAEPAPSKTIGAVDAINSAAAAEIPAPKFAFPTSGAAQTVPRKEVFSFSSPVGSSSKNGHTAETTENGSSDFVFPEVQVTAVLLDSAKVDGFRALFEF